MRDCMNNFKPNGYRLLNVADGRIFDDSGWDLADYVLGHFSDEDNIKLKEIMPDIIQAVTLMVQGDVDKAMNDFNAKK